MNGFKKISPCENHGKYYCDAKGCKVINYYSGIDPGDDSEFLDKHRKQWPRYNPQWKNGAARK